MDSVVNKVFCKTLQSALALLVVAALASMSQGQPNGFVEDFNDPNLDPAWNQNGDPNGHPTTFAGTYDLTDAFGAPGTILNRSTGGTTGSFIHEIEVVLDPHLISGSGGTRSDFKFRSMGAKGIFDVVYNMFGN